MSNKITSLDSTIIIDHMNIKYIRDLMVGDIRIARGLPDMSDARRIRY